MKLFVLAAALATAALVQTAAFAQERPVETAHRPIPVHICKPGYSWQQGCLKYGPTPPGKLFGQCLQTGYGCFRTAGPIQ